MTTSLTTSTTDSQWQSHFLRYNDTRPNGDALRKCILQGPYIPSTLIILAKEATDDSPAVLERTAFLQQLQPEWSRFMTIVKQNHDLDTVSYHKLFDVLKQYQKEVNEIRVERIAKNANPLALVAAAQQYPDPYYQAPKSHKSYAPPSKQSSSTRSNASTKYKGKEIAKPITPLSESASEEDSDPEQAQRGKDMQKKLALIAKYFKKIYKPTNNNLRTSSNSKNKNVDTSLRYKKIIRLGRLGIRGQKPKRVKDYTYHKENMLFRKQDEKGVPLQAEQADYLEDTYKEIDEQELETDLEKYMTFNDRTVDYDKLECKLNETLELLAQKENNIKEGLKLKAYEISVVKEKHDELVKQSFLTKSHYEGLVKEKTKVIMDLKLKEEKDIDKMISMEKQLKFLNEIVFKSNQSIKTIHMLAPKGSTFNGRPTFSNPMYLEKA
ncbi:hypothetical protein Tco_0870755 [Tanacetum coccineum]